MRSKVPLRGNPALVFVALAKDTSVPPQISGLFYTQPMNLELVLANINDKKVLKDLLQEYQREILGKDPGEYKYLDGYWEKADRHPFFITVNNIIAGFVLVNCHTLINKDAKNISEFYIKKNTAIGI